MNIELVPILNCLYRICKDGNFSLVEIGINNDYLYFCYNDIKYKLSVSTLLIEKVVDRYFLVSDDDSNCLTKKIRYEIW